MEVALLWVVADLFCEEVERVCVVAEGLDVVIDPDEDLETVAEDLDEVEPEADLETVADDLDEVELDDLTAEPPERVEVEPEDLVDVEPEDLVDELDLDEDEEDEDPVEPLCDVVVVDLRV